MSNNVVPGLAGLPAALLPALLELLPSGVVCYSPMQDAAGTVVDFSIAYLNPAARRLLGLPGQAAEAAPLPAASLAFCRATYLSGEPGHGELAYAVAGSVAYFEVAGQRVGDVLLLTLAAIAPPRLAPKATLVEQLIYPEVEHERRVLQAVLAQAPVGIGVFEGEQQLVTAANDMLCTIWGYEPEQVLGRPRLEGIPEMQGQGFAELMHEVRRTGVPFVGKEMPATLLENGQLQTHYYNFIYQPLYGPAAEMLGVMTIVFNVTEQVLARRRVQDLNEELAATNEELRASNEEYLLANTALAEAQQALQALNQELEARVAERTQEAQLAHADAERQKGRFERLIMEAPLAICVLKGPDWVFEFINPRYRQIVPGRQLLGRPILEAVPEAAALADVLQQVYDTGVSFERHEMAVSLSRPPGSPPESKYFNLTYQARYDEAGSIDGMVMFVDDSTEQVLARRRVQDLNEELATMNEELQASNEELGESNRQLLRTNADLDNFIYTASHDLKQPISNIEGLLKLLDELLPEAARADEDVAPVLGLMQGAVERFKRTIGHLTEVSKLQLEFDQPPAPVLLAQVVEDVRQDLRPLLAETSGRLLVDVGTHRPRVFSEKNLRSIVYNLLSNALKYHYPGRPPLVYVTCRAEGRYLVLAVQDNGLGLNAQQQTRLFQLFQRLHTHVEGSGLGLYMVKKIVEHAGGTLLVQSQPEVGTKFVLTFPA